MKISRLAMMMTLATMTLPGCGEGTSAPSETTSPDGGGAGGQGTTVQPEDFELDGSWLYLGPWDGAHTLKISNKSVEYADIAEEWASSWTIKEYDNGLDQFQIVFASGSGTYSPAGQSFSGSYDLKERTLTVQLSEGLKSYLPVRSPGSCLEEGSDFIPDCKLYMKQ